MHEPEPFTLTASEVLVVLAGLKGYTEQYLPGGPELVAKLRSRWPACKVAIDGHACHMQGPHEFHSTVIDKQAVFWPNPANPGQSRPGYPTT